MRLVPISFCFSALVRAAFGLPLVLVACQVPASQLSSQVNCDELGEMKSSFSDELVKKYIVLEKQRRRVQVEQCVPWRDGALLLAKYSPVGYHPADRRLVGFWDGDSIDCRATDYLSRDVELDGTVQGLVGGFPLYQDWVGEHEVRDLSAQLLISRAVLERLLVSDSGASMLNLSRLGGEVFISREIGSDTPEIMGRLPYSISDRFVELTWENGRLTKLTQRLPSSFSPEGEKSSLARLGSGPSAHWEYVASDAFEFLRYKGPFDNRNRAEWEQLVLEALSNDWFGVQYAFHGRELKWIEGVGDFGRGYKWTLQVLLNGNEGEEMVSFLWLGGQLTEIVYLVGGQTQE